MYNKEERKRIKEEQERRDTFWGTIQNLAVIGIPIWLIAQIPNVLTFIFPVFCITCIVTGYLILSNSWR